MILVAPDSFKGTFTSLEVARAVAAGVRAAGAAVDVCPLADGGEGTADVLLALRGGQTRLVEATDPFGRRRRAAFALLGDGRTAVVDAAAASGFVSVGERDPEGATTYGTGELIVAAVEAGARAILVGAGGTATTDGGAGCLDAIRAGGGLRGAELVVLCDVATPWERAAATFAPQKGADDAAVERLSRRLERMAGALPRDPRGIERTGCGGGLSGALWAAHGARLVSGARCVLAAARFEQRLAACSALVTGEGRLDEQSRAGKLVGTVLAGNRRTVPAYAVVGRCALEPAAIRAFGLACVWEAPTLAELERAGRALVAEVSQQANADTGPRSQLEGGRDGGRRDERAWQPSHDPGRTCSTPSTTGSSS